MPQTIDDYIRAHTTPESPVLQELNRQTHLKMLYPRMLSGHLQGRFLAMVSRMLQPRYILEIGTFTGYSAICLAEGLQANGQIHTIDHDDETRDFARSYIDKAGLSQQIILHTGNALDLIPLMTQAFDLVFIDADKREYKAYYEAVMKLLKPGAFILADNVLWDGKVIDPTQKDDPYNQAIIEFNRHVQQDKRVENLILPLRDGLMLLQKK